MKPIPAAQWVAWIVATGVAAFTMISYVHANFSSIREVNSIHTRLDRIEKKIDLIITNGNYTGR